MVDMRMRRALLALGLAVFASVVGVVPATAVTGDTGAATVRVPLELDYITLREALRRQLYTAPGGRADLWHGSNACQFFRAERPSLARRGDAVVFDTFGALSLGLSVAGGCVTPISWNGIVEIVAEPYLTSTLALKFRVRDLNLFNLQHEKTLVASRSFDLIKQNLVPGFEAFSFDLAPAVRQLGELVEAAVAPGEVERVKATLATIRGEGPVVPGQDGVRVTLEMMMPVAAPTPAATAAPLTPEEVAAWQKKLDDWDAFLVFAIKQIGLSGGTVEMRGQLRDLLLDSRYKLVAALNKPVGGGPDPIRLLFLDAWRRLRDVVRSGAKRDAFGSRALEFLSFISAGDALFAFDQAAPALGMRISAQDLRRLAHIMAPVVTSDPLKFDFEEDPELKKLFDVPRPLEQPGPLETPAPSPEPASTTLRGLWRSLARWLEPTQAWAAKGDRAAEIKALGGKLRLVVVSDENHENYRRDIGRLLELSAERAVNEQNAGSDPTPFRRLVKSTAWQESCWRQFIRVRGRIGYLLSTTGDIGLMQVNKHVWRGFYSIRRLEWDIVYNVSAGTEILVEMRRYAMARGAGGSNDLARSVYSAYNGGPGAYDRWRHANLPADLRLIDNSFWSKYQALRRGQTLNILQCSARWAASH